MDANRFGCFVAERRKELKMTQKDLAAKIQVTDKAVSAVRLFTIVFSLDEKQVPIYTFQCVLYKNEKGDFLCQRKQKSKKVLVKSFFDSLFWAY